MKGPYRALFYQGSPEINLAGSILGPIGGSRRVQRVHKALVEFLNDQKKGPNMVSGAIECIMYYCGFDLR